MTARDQEEYRALRSTIRERGTARVWIFVVGIAAWAALLVTTAAVAAPPAAMLIPLLVLASTFEAVHGLHIGVERIGRYIQVFHEDGAPAWETVAMAFGRPAASVRTDALFSLPFGLAAAINVVPGVLVGPTREEFIFVAGAHALFLLRIAVARAGAGRQRAIDLERFQTMKREMSGR
jgi:hypothetical protein